MITLPDVMMGAVVAMALVCWFAVAVAGSRQAWRDLDDE